MSGQLREQLQEPDHLDAVLEKSLPAVPSLCNTRTQTCFAAAWRGSRLHTPLCVFTSRHVCLGFSRFPAGRAPLLSVSMLLPLPLRWLRDRGLLETVCLAVHHTFSQRPPTPRAAPAMTERDRPVLGDRG